MDSSDEDFLRELQAAFQIEADEHLQAMSSGLLALEQAPADGQPQTPLLETIFREAHSLKGAARAVNLMDVETVCQSLETVFAAWKRHEIAPSATAFDTLHHALDLLGALLDATPEGGAAPARHQILDITQQLSLVGSGITNGALPVGASLAAPAEPSAEEQAKPPGGREKAASETVRISTAKLDALLLQAEEMLAIKQTSGQQALDLREIQTDARIALERWQKERHRRSPGELPVLSPRTLELLDWNYAFLQALDKRLSGLAKSAAQDHRDTTGKVDALLEETKKLLMLPFTTILGTLPKMVRDLARDEGKEIQMVMQGGGIEIDKRILEEMKDPLIHLLRNSVDHGIETPEDRAAQQKPPRATVTLSITQVSGSEIEILIADDGAGIDTDRVKASAIKHGALTEEEARQMSETEAQYLIFQSEVSTSPIITEISGRGLGMAIVREKVENLGGRIHIETQRGQGTTFHILLPLTLATFKGILVRVSDQTFVLPTANMEFADRIHLEDIQTVENRETVALKGRLISLVSLHDLLELPLRDTRADNSDFLPVVVLGSTERRIALRVDEILNEQEVLVKPLSKPLLRVRNVAGATILGSGKPVAVLNAADLIQSAVKFAGAPSRVIVTGSEEDPQSRSILLAEDSITSRMLLKNILESAGYQVTTAVDGLDALTTLKTQDFALVVSDVDMPRLNGFELTERIRADQTFAELPIVLVTARDTREDRERGVDVGASAYLVKSSFDQSNLLAVIQRLI